VCTYERPPLSARVEKCPLKRTNVDRRWRRHNVNYTNPCKRLCPPSLPHTLPSSEIPLSGERSLTFAFTRTRWSIRVIRTLSFGRLKTVPGQVALLRRTCGDRTRFSFLRRRDNGKASPGKLSNVVVRSCPGVEKFNVNASHGPGRSTKSKSD